MVSTTVEKLHRRGMRLFPLKVDQYHEMIARGIVQEGEPYELLEGAIVRKDRSASGEDPMTVGDDHAYSLMKLTQLNPRLQRLGCHLRPQLPILLPPHSEPEPDGTVVRGTAERYVGRKPAVEDILCVIEIADSSLGRDRGPKSRIYAKGGVAAYWIINLRDRVIEVYTGPMRNGRYARTITKRADESAILPTTKGKGLTIPAAGLLPPPGRAGAGPQNGR